MTRLSRWVGLLEVIDGPFVDETPIFYPDSDPFVVCFHVRPLAWLPVEKAVPIHDDRVWNQLSSTRGQSKRWSSWTGKLRSSLVQLDEADGVFLERCRARQEIDGVGPIVACHLLAEIGEASRFRRAEQIIRLAGLDPVVDESGETRRRGHLAKAGSPHLRWALVEAAVHANRQTAPDVAVYRAARAPRDATVARLIVARTIGKRVYRTLRDLELAAA